MSAASDAYRLGLMGPKTRAEYEDAVRRGVVQDRYAADRIALERSNPALRNGAEAVTTFMRALLPGLGEAGAATQAGVQSARALLQGKPADFGRAYNDARTQQAAAVDDFRAQHPVVADLTKGLGYAGQAVPVVLSGGATAAPEAEALGLRTLATRVGAKGALPRAAGAMDRATTNVGRNAVTGAGYAAANAAGQPGGFNQRMVAASRAVPAGALTGAAIPAGVSVGVNSAKVVPFVAKRTASVASELASAASRALSGKTPYDQASEIPPEIAAQGQQAAIAYLRHLGATPEGLREAALAANGKPITTAEAIGPVGISQATGIARRTGTTPALADATLVARRNDRGERILSDIADATGVDPSVARGHVEALVDQGRKMAGPLFQAIRDLPGPIMTPELAQWAETPIGKKAIVSAAQEIRNIPGGDPFAHGLPVDPDTGAIGSSDPSSLDQLELQPTAATWDLIRKHVGDQVDRDAFGRIIPDEQSRGNRNINENKRILTQILAGDGTGANPGVIPGYRQALDQSGDYLGIQNAFDANRGMLFGRSLKADPTDFAKRFAGYKPIEQEAVKAAMANDILTAVQNGTLRPGSFSLPHVQTKLKAAFGNDATAKLTQAIDAEAKMAAAEARMRPNLNSVTGDTMGAMADQTAPTDVAAAKAVGHLALGKPTRAAGALARGLTPYVSAARQPFDEAARNALGDLLYSDPADAATLLELHSSPDLMTLPSITVRQPLAAVAAASGGADQNGQ